MPKRFDKLIDIDTQNRIINMYSEGYGPGQIVKEIGLSCSYKTVARFLSRKGIVRKKGHSKRKKRGPYIPRRDKEPISDHEWQTIKQVLVNMHAANRSIFEMINAIKRYHGLSFSYEKISNIVFDLERKKCEYNLYQPNQSDFTGLEIKILQDHLREL